MYCRPPWETLLGVNKTEPTITIPASELNYGNTRQPSLSSSSSSSAPSSSASPSTTATTTTPSTTPTVEDTTTTTTGNKRNNKNKTNKSNKTTDAKTNVQATNDKPKEQDNKPKEQDDTKVDTIVQFAVLRGTKASSLVEPKRDSKRLEKHKQRMLLYPFLFLYLFT